MEQGSGLEHNNKAANKYDVGSSVNGRLYTVPMRAAGNADSFHIVVIEDYHVLNNDGRMELLRHLSVVITVCNRK